MRATLMIALLTVLSVLGFGVWFLTAKGTPVHARGSRSQGLEVEEDLRPFDGSLRAQEPNAPTSELEESRVPSRPDVEGLPLSDESPSPTYENEADEEIARFDRSVRKFDERRRILRDELERGLVDEEASLKWESRTRDSVAPDLGEVEVQVQCSATICEIVLQSPHPSGTLLAHSARYLRELNENTVGARETEPDLQSDAREGEQLPEGFSVLFRRDDQKGER